MRKPEDIYDEWLVLKCQNGDQKAYSQLIQKWNSKVHSQAYYHMRDSDGANDVAQEVWSSVIKSIHRLKDPVKFKSWLYKIVYLKSVDWIRLRKKQRDLMGNTQELQESLNSEPSDDSQVSLILKALGEMNTAERMIIRLFYLEGQSIKSISGILGVPVGTVKSKLFYAREHLKKLLKEKKYEQEQ